MKLERDPVWGPVFNQFVYRLADRLRDLVEFLPQPVARAGGRWIGRLASAVVKSKLKAASAQAEMALGPGGARFAPRSVVEFGQLAIEVMQITSTYSRERFRRHVTVVGEENLRAARALGKGVVAVSAHLGNWEVGAAVLGHLGYPPTWLLRPIENPALQEAINAIRATAGIRVITKWGGLREAIHVLRRGEVLAMLVDQDARDQGVFVPFFGKEASTLKSPALLSLRTGAPIVPFAALRQPDGSFVVEIAEGFVPEGSADQEADLARATAKFTRTIEEWIRKHPEQWLWVHRRWKTQRGGAASTQAATG
ncbi:MAG: lysophospholipid acyltransferase family protein [Planctomycetia bacterium]|nr:lysophospholipid acyltransferase family protein [Planctomycetia bacterium]